jgi:ribosomal-protein-alanine N-acetyltransferase
LGHGTNLAIVANTFALTHNEVSVRVVRLKDAKRLERLVLGNREWLRPWEATNPDGPNSFDIKAQIRGLLKQMSKQQGLPLVIEHAGQVVGQLNVSNIIYGSVGSCIIGYWIAPEFAGKSITTKAVALTTDYLLNVAGLHRVEIDIRPENSASLRVVEKLGFRYEGLKERFIHINGDWRDHYVFALTLEDVPAGVLSRFSNDKVPAINYPYKTARN